MKSNDKNNLPHISEEQGNLVTLLSARDAKDTIKSVEQVDVMMIDPWYNKGAGGTRDDYGAWLREIVHLAAERSEHIFVWGFPEIVCQVLIDLPPKTELLAWLTWYFKNCPSVIRGWRSAQQACLHIAQQGAKLHPERFLNEKQLQLKSEGKLRYMPGPPSVIEVPLNIGFVGKHEQMGHPAQKPESVFQTLLKMAAPEGGIVCDPFCGAGTTGSVAAKMGLRSILSDSSEEYINMTEQRLGIKCRQNIVEGIHTHAASQPLLTLEQ